MLWVSRANAVNCAAAGAGTSATTAQRALANAASLVHD
jgi:hypothetical protein